jgi:hypothetical protein
VLIIEKIWNKKKRRTIKVIGGGKSRTDHLTNG